ncbi:MAG: acetate kinase [Candidatus Omnitrophota bacterium]
MLILVINSGSSSLKYQVFDINRKKSVAKGRIERIGERNSRIRDHDHAVKIMVRQLMAPKTGAIKDISDIEAIGHRVVHGQEEFNKAVLINARVTNAINRYSELAPLHNPPALMAIHACLKQFSGIPQVAIFDTAFHQTMPRHSYLYGLPVRLYEKYKIRRYGFHGTSHKFVAHQAGKILKKPLTRLNLITCHLGNGCSITAIKSGKSVDTSMGFTPLEGLLMGTRCGDMDPAIVFFLMEKEKLNAEEASDLLNRKSGLLGLSGITNDMRDLIKYAKKGSKKAKDAIEVFIYRIKKYIGAYAAVLGKVDAVIFTAGIGENQAYLRSRIVRELNHVLGSAKILVIPTNEELQIATETHEVVNGKR